jgi:hypothetical protein
MAIDLDQVARKGNGHTPLPLSRRAFQRALPHRVGSIEDDLDGHERRMDELAYRLAAIEARSEDTTLSARVDLVEQIVDLVRLVLGKRRSRRRTR